MTTVADQLSKRVSDLEAALHRLRVFVLVAVPIASVGTLFALGVALYGMGTSQSGSVTQAGSIVRADSVEIIDERGNPLVTLGKDEKGGYIALKRPEGTELARLFSNPTGGAFRMDDDQGVPLITMSALAEKGKQSFGGKIAVHDERNRERVILRGGILPGVDVQNGSGKSAASLSEVAGYGNMALNNEAGNPVVQAGEVPIADGYLGTASRVRVLNGRDSDKKQTVFEIGLNDQGGIATAFQIDGKASAYFGAGEGGGGIALHNLDQKVVWAAIAKRDGGALSLCNGEGLSVFRAGADPNGSGMFYIARNDGKTGLSGAVHHDGGFLSIFNPAGREVCQMYADGGEGSIGVWDQDGKGRTLQPK